MYIPDYAPLSISVNKTPIIEEIQTLSRDLFSRIAPVKFEKSRLPYRFDPGTPFEICTPEEYEGLSYDYWDGPERHSVEGRFKTFTHLILTHPRVDEEDRYKDNVRDPEGKICRPYMLHQYPWSWRDDVRVPRIRNFVATLPFEYVQRVRIIALWEGEHIGNVHRDSVPYFTDPWRASGHGVINTNLLNGGSVLKLELPNKEIIDIDDDCFTFNECLFHGSTRGDKARIQLNVVGKFNATFSSLVRTNEAR